MTKKLISLCLVFTCIAVHADDADVDRYSNVRVELSRDSGAYTTFGVIGDFGIRDSSSMRLSLVNTRDDQGDPYTRYYALGFNSDTLADSYVGFEIGATSYNTNIKTRWLRGSYGLNFEKWLVTLAPEFRGIDINRAINAAYSLGFGINVTRILSDNWDISLGYTTYNYSTDLSAVRNNLQRLDYLFPQFTGFVRGLEKSHANIGVAYYTDAWSFFFDVFRSRTALENDVLGGGNLNALYKSSGKMEYSLTAGWQRSEYADRLFLIGVSAGIRW